MAVNNPYATYKQSSVETKSAGELTLMLYEGCLKFIKRAEQAIENKNIEDKNTNLIKAQNIIRELMVTLNTDVAVSANMMQMYDFIMAKLVEANTGNDVEPLKEAEEFVIDFRDTWREVIKLDRQQRHGIKGEASRSVDSVGSSSTGSAGSTAIGGNTTVSSSDARSQGQAVGRITPEKRVVEKTRVESDASAKDPAATAHETPSPSVARPAAVPNNPYAKVASNNPYAQAKRAAAAAGAGITSYRK